MRNMKVTHSPTKPYVVLVTYPGSSKQYAYWCDIPGIAVNSMVVMNNAACTVRAIVDHDDRATKWIPGSFKSQFGNRRAEIAQRLHEIEKEEQLLDRWSKLKSSEAKKLVAELRRLQS
jgi:hypothetical protein